MSSLFTGERRAKSDAVFEVLGNIDELNANLGMAEVNSTDTEMSEQLQEIQSRLFDIGAHVATPRSSGDQEKINLTQMSLENVQELERWIDRYDSQLPTLTNFILPGGSSCSSSLHISRAICRRTERSMVPIYHEEQIDEPVFKYINRLSDFLFMAARFAAKADGAEEKIYKKIK